MKKEKILVVGASGNVGSEISKLLAQEGYSVRAASSKKPSQQKIDNIEQVQLNLLTGEGLKQAFAEVDRAFLISPAGFADQHVILSPLIQEAKRRGLKKVVLMTAMGADANEASPLRRAEVELEKSGLTYNIVRPNWFMQNFNTYWIQGIREQGKILVPGGDAKVSFIDTRDIAAVSVKLLTTDDKKNRAFTLTGPEALNHDEVAQALSSATGRNISYENIEPAVLKKGLLAAGLPEDYSDFLLLILGFLREGYNAKVTDDVSVILDRAPTGIQKYAQDYGRIL